MVAPVHSSITLVAQASAGQTTWFTQHEPGVVPVTSLPSFEQTPAGQVHAMSAPVHVSVTFVLQLVPQVALVTQHVPVAPPCTTVPPTAMHTAPGAVHLQVRFEPSPFGKVGLAPFEQIAPDRPVAPKAAQAW
jgi:hypothetical protein